jgi:hypothetical protein
MWCIESKMNFGKTAMKYLKPAIQTDILYSSFAIQNIYTKLDPVYMRCSPGLQCEQA